MNISLVCACKNRADSLKVSLASWLHFKEIKEIIIVDWSSDEPINYLTELDPRIKIVRVSDQKYFNQPQPLNLAISLAAGDYILKADVDYVLNPYYDIFDKYQVDNQSFVSGKPNYVNPEYVDPETGNVMIDNSEMTFDNMVDYVNCYSPFFKHLTGFLFIKRENLLKVGGYNESLNKYYAFEDDEIFRRLEIYGLEHKKMDFDGYVMHIPHPDKKRIENFRGFDEDEYKQIIESLPEGQQKWETEYYVSQVHISNNKEMCGEIKDYYVEPKTKWDIKKIDEQNLFAEMVMNKKLDGLTSVYYISLEESQDRRDHLETEFGKYGIKPVSLISKRFAECNDVVTGKYVDTLNEGTKGCCVSQLKAIKNWYDNTDEIYGFFCEDDLSLETVEYWDFTWQEFLEKIPEDADCVQLLTIRKDFDTFDLRERYWDDWGATAYILTRDYAKKLIDTYIKENSYHLEIPGEDIMPLIENIIFTNIGKTYTCPLFVEETKFQSTHIGKDDDIVDGQKTNHYLANQKVLDWWKSKSVKEEKKKFKTFTIKTQNISQIDVKDIKVVDCFSYFGDKELLELRVNLLKDYVEKFIISESNYTLGGDPKEYTLKNTIEELGLPKEKIKVIEVDLSLENLGDPDDYDLFYDGGRKYPCREKVMRDSIMNCVDEFDYKTYFMVSNYEEIINPKYLDFLIETVRDNAGVYFKIPLVKLSTQADLRWMHSDGNIVEWKDSMFICTKSSLKLTTPTRIRASFFLPYSIAYPYVGRYQAQDLGWCFSKDVPSGNLTLSPYPMDSLPQVIFDLPAVKKFLLPKLKNVTKKTELEQLLHDFSLDTENAEKNFNLGLWYEREGHTAPALSYFLRSAERSDDNDFAYESLLKCHHCYDKQGTRDGTAISLLQQAICLLPKRPEAYFLLARFHERREQWNDCYKTACLGLATCDFDCKPLTSNIEYPGKYGLLFEKAVSGYWWGKGKEARRLLREIKNNYELNEEYFNAVQSNLMSLGSGYISEDEIKYNKDKYDRLKFKFPESEKIERNYSQAYQDMFILAMLNGKRNGLYLEVGAQEPFYQNNTALLETNYDWKGISIEIREDLCKMFAEQRKNTILCADATQVDYDKLLSNFDQGIVFDYLQVDCEPASTTFDILTKIPLDKYKFAIITYEHDFSADVTSSYRAKSREYLQSFGYQLAVKDVAPDDEYTFEDWWVHPDLVDANLLEKMKSTDLEVTNVIKYFFE